MVTITAAGEYTIEGTLTEGQIAVASATSDDEIILNLNNVSVTNTTDDAFKGSTGKVTLVPMADTQNTFSATADSACAIYSKHDITIKGEGKINAISQTGNGIRSKADLEVGVCDLYRKAGNNGLIQVSRKRKPFRVPEKYVCLLFRRCHVRSVYIEKDNRRNHIGQNYQNHRFRYV